MSENLFNSAHKAATPAYREGYDRIEWDAPEDNQEDACTVPTAT